MVELDAAVVGRVGQRFPHEPVRTLDAIHLANAQLFEERVGIKLVMLSTDQRIRMNALDLGFQVLPAAE